MSRPFNRMHARLLARSPTADIPTFAALRNTRQLMPSGDPAMLLIDRHFAGELLEQMLKSVYVDEQWYRERNPDIAEALANGAITTAKDHYIRFGYFEHRMPYRIEVVEDWYLEQYPDVRASVHKGVFTSAQEHFEIAGYREGRMPYANFSLLSG